MSSVAQAIKGNIIFAEEWNEIKVYPESYIVYAEGRVQGIYKKLTEEYANIEIVDYRDALIIPGCIDLHTHAAQFMQRGLGYDKELIEWLKEYTFPTEQAFHNESHAKAIYQLFIDALIRKGTTRASILATTHKKSTDLLFGIAAEKGLGAVIGKVNMDQHCPDSMKENTQQSLYDTEELLCKYKNHPMVQPIITPRFVPTCSKELLTGLGELANRYQIPVQSHLSENRDEVAWVKELYPKHATYADVYDEYGLFGQTPTLMAHCIYLEEDELKLLGKRNVTAVHCPQANMNLASGLMPLERWRERGVKLGLGSDVGAGHELAMSKIMVQAIQSSKLIKTATPSLAEKRSPLTYKEAFYLGTKGNGKFFNSLATYQERNLRVGSLETGYAFDALVIDDSNLGTTDISIEERLQRYMYLGDDRNIIQRYIEGKQIQ